MNNWQLLSVNRTEKIFSNSWSRVKASWLVCQWVVVLLQAVRLLLRPLRLSKRQRKRPRKRSLATVKTVTWEWDCLIKNCLDESCTWTILIIFTSFMPKYFKINVKFHKEEMGFVMLS